MFHTDMTIDMAVHFQERSWVNSVLGCSLDITLLSFFIVEASATEKWRCEFFSSNTREKIVLIPFQWEMIVPLFFSIYFKSTFIFHLQWWSQCLLLLIIHHLIILLSPNRSSILAFLQCLLCMTPARIFKAVLIIPLSLPKLMLALNTFLDG